MLFVVDNVSVDKFQCHYLVALTEPLDRYNLCLVTLQ